jgi:hypothetical protein
MNNFMGKKLFDAYGFTRDFSKIIPDTIRYPPSGNIPKGLISTPGLNVKLSTDNALLNPKLDDFLQMYQQMASGLIDMSVDKLIPPGHPMYSKENSITLLKEENEKILKENLELKKRLEDKKNSVKI